jgi:hypothetical protein
MQRCCGHDADETALREQCAAALAGRQRFTPLQWAIWADVDAQSVGGPQLIALTETINDAHGKVFTAWSAARKHLCAREERSVINAAVRRHAATAARPTEAQLNWRRSDSDPVADLQDAVFLDDDPSMLRQSGVDVARGFDGRGLGSTWLHAAAQAECSSAMIPFLLAAGADVNARDAFVDDTPLHNAARGGRLFAAAELLAAGADVSAQNFLNFTPLHLACNYGHGDVAKLLRAAGSPLNSRSLNEGLPPLWSAISNGHADTVAVMLALPWSALDGTVDLTLPRLPPKGGSLLSHALEPSTKRQAARVRQLMVCAAVAREAERAGSGDPEDLLALRHPRPAERGASRMAGARFVPASDAPAGRARDVALGRASRAHLPDACRVVRYADGATVVDAEATLVHSEFVCPFTDEERDAAKLALLMATHRRLGEHSPARVLCKEALAHIMLLLPRPRSKCGAACRGGVCACVAAGWPCFFDCPDACSAANPLNAGALAALSIATGRRVASLSQCALDHLSTVRSLTPAQLKARYPHACAERWGGAPKVHMHYGRPGVPLRALLAPAGGLLSTSGKDACDACAGDGAQFFSFCLNRPVNADRVMHCMACGRCAYFRPYFPSRRCPYCGRCPRLEGDDESDDDETTSKEMAFAAEGYWAY